MGLSSLRDDIPHQPHWREVPASEASGGAGRGLLAFRGNKQEASGQGIGDAEQAWLLTGATFPCPVADCFFSAKGGEYNFSDSPPKAEKINAPEK